MKFRVKEIREMKNMTQEELEKKSGISRQTISAMENGRSESVKTGTLFALAKALDASLDDFFSNSGLVD